MNEAAYLTIFTILIMLSTYVYSLNFKRLFNRINAFALQLCAGLVMTEYMILKATHHYDVVVYNDIHTLFVLSILALEGVIALIFSGLFENHPKEKLYHRLTIGFIAASCLTIFMISTQSGDAATLIERKDGVWVYTLMNDSIFGDIMQLLFLVMFAFIGYCFFVAYKKTMITKERNWKLGLFIFYSVISLLVFVQFIWYPNQNEFSYYNTAPYVFIWVGSLSWGYFKFRLFELDPKDVMDDILESVANLVILTDPILIIRHKNGLAEKIMSSETKLCEVLGKSEDIDVEKFIQDLNKLSSSEKLECNFKLKVNGEDKSYCLVAKKIIKKTNHTGFSFVATDITSRVEREKKLQDYNVQLENKNQELERFAYVASHDLKTPLRNIISFLTLLKRKLKNHSDTDVRDFMDITQSNAQNMYNLVEEILEYSLVKAEGIKLMEVDMNEVLNLVEKNLSNFLDEKNAKIKYGKLPRIEANHHQMLQLFQNLVGNGLKYNNSKDPKVTISVFEENEYLVFKVEDNGIGISPQYHKTVFEIFKRLHNQAEYQGSGVGLAICNKIVSNHGGHIELISVENVGSIFMVHLKVKVLQDEVEEVEVLEKIS